MVKQPLQIRLTEPVIFLRGPSTGLDFRGRPQAVREDAPPAMLRGLLTLRLSKPTRIRRIDIKLEGKARTEWPEGIGPRRLDTFEEHAIVEDRTTFYTYKDQLEPRRSESIGPGLALDRYAYDDEDAETLSPGEERDFDWTQSTDRGRDRIPRSASALPDGEWSRGRASGRPTVESPLEGFENLAFDPGPSPAYTPELHSGESSRASSIRNVAPSRSMREPILSPIMSAAPSRAASDRTESTSTERRLEQRRVEREPLPGVTESEELRPILDVGSRRTSGSAAVRFEDTRRSERSSLAGTPEDEHAPSAAHVRRSRTSSILTTDSTASDATFSSNTHEADVDHAPGYHPTSSAVQPTSGHATPIHTPAPSAPPSLRAQSSVEDLNADHPDPSPPTSRPGTQPTSTATSAASSRSDLREVRPGRTARNGSVTTIIINHDSPPISGFTQVSASSNTHTPIPGQPSPLQRPPITLSSDDRGRRDHKFSLSAALRGLSQDVKDRVRNKSRSRTGSAAPSRRSSFSEQNGSTSRPPALPLHLQDGERSRSDFHPPHGRGGAGRASSRDRSTDRADSHGRGRGKGMKALTGALHLGDEDEPEHIHHWKEFKKGTYNYPISFPIPVDAPPTIHAEFGSVSYRLKATVVRVGALTPNLVDEMEVMMIASPQEDDLEETENVIVERQWEEQMRYQITLHGKAFPIGGTIPISIRLMPLLKCKIHRVSVALEEKTDYYAQERKVARHEQPKRYTLLFVKQPEKKERIEPLLPIISDDVNAARESPLASMAKTAALNDPERLSDFDLDGQDDDRMYAGLMDPLGPWHLEKSLQIPDCNAKIRFTTKHDKTNISVGHSLKVTLRVERGDDEAMDAKGRRKQFDIIIETPIKILDCRVNPQWNSLPTYSAYHANAYAAQTVCSLHNKAKNPPLQADASGSRVMPAIASSSSMPQNPVDARIASSDALFAHGNGSGSVAGRPARGRTPTAHGEGGEDTLLERNIVYDRLMSGQETETGEVPPTYIEAVAAAVRSASASRSASRPRFSRSGTAEDEVLMMRSGSGTGTVTGRSRDAGGGGSRSVSRVRDGDGDRSGSASRSVSRIRGEGGEREGRSGGGSGFATGMGFGRDGREGSRSHSRHR